MSREEILDRVRGAVQAGQSLPLAEAREPYVTRGSLAAEDVVKLFLHRLQEYGAGVRESTAAGLAAEIEVTLRAAGRRRVVVPPGLPETWRSPATEWMVDEGLEYAEIERAEGVLTGASAGVAESGTIVLQHGPAEGRRVLTLLPDYHLCVMEAAQVVETLPESFARMQGAPRLVTFISGPSATADIEMTRIKGVHGPRFLDVILVR